MKLTNGSHYKTADGTIVRVQRESDGRMVAYDATGRMVTAVSADEHVNGWEPVGVADYKAARKAVTARPSKKKVTKKKG